LLILDASETSSAQINEVSCFLQQRQ